MVDKLIDQWDGWTEHQRALDIEYLFGWNPAFWNAKAWTIAVGEGLFTHVERAEHVEVGTRLSDTLVLETHCHSVTCYLRADERAGACAETIPESCSRRAKNGLFAADVWLNYKVHSEPHIFVAKM
jgi:hypothetical protein